MRAALAVLLALAGCVREPIDRLCPDVPTGSLVITEIRGPQNPDDALGPWVELFNTTAAPIDLVGTKVRFRRKDGSSEVQILVRDSVTIGAGAYAVLGLVDPVNLPDHVDYSFAPDFTETWLSAAAVDVESCGARIDRAVYDVLPKQGTFALTGAMAPDATMNDDLRFWCTDATMTATVFPGSPQQANPACPATP